MDLSPVSALQIMTRNLATTTPNVHVLNAVDKLIAQRVSGLPVVTETHVLIGRFTEQSAIAALDLAGLSDKPSSLNSRSCLNLLIAADVMKPPSLVLHSHSDVMSCTDQLIRKGVSGAPVLASDGTVLGVFSEKSAMQVFIRLCWEQSPCAAVTAWMDDEPGRMINEQTTLPEILERFHQTSFRRLLVTRQGRLIGEITRRDALSAAVTAIRTPLVESQDRADMNGLAYKATVSFWMQHEVPVVSPALNVLSIAQNFIESSVRQLPVVDDGSLLGQISRSDLLRAVQRFFPVPQPAAARPQPLYLSAVAPGREFVTT
ncbi:MAG: CBS domain-containing protein [Planctomycetaceae bacterium]